MDDVRILQMEWAHWLTLAGMKTLLSISKKEPQNLEMSMCYRLQAVIDCKALIMLMEFIYFNYLNYFNLSKY